MKGANPVARIVALFKAGDASHLFRPPAGGRRHGSITRRASSLRRWWACQRDQHAACQAEGCSSGVNQSRYRITLPVRLTRRAFQSSITAVMCR